MRRSGSTGNLAQAIMDIGRGILKFNESEKSAQSILVETHSLTDDGQLFCAIDEHSASLWPAVGNLPITLKFVQKAKGLFIKLTGRVRLMPNSTTGGPKLLRITVDAISGFKKISSTAAHGIIESFSSLDKIQYVPPSRAIAG